MKPLTFELRFCPLCQQMTNHAKRIEGVYECMKCRSVTRE